MYVCLVLTCLHTFVPRDVLNIPIPIRCSYVSLEVEVHFLLLCQSSSAMNIQQLLQCLGIAKVGKLDVLSD